jgi:hypothetical protein
MIDVTSAVTAASRYFKEIEGVLNIGSPGNLDPKMSPENLRLEEVKKTEDSNHWLITLGYDAPFKPPYVRTLFPAATPQPEYEYSREYKLFRVNGETGEVEAMEIRKV